MPNQPKTPNRIIRVPDTDWAELGEAAAAMGTDRSAVLRQLAAWWMRKPGAKMPPRPPAAARPAGTMWPRRPVG